MAYLRYTLRTQRIATYTWPMDSTKTKIITLAGSPASGKSSTAKGVAAQLGYQHFSSGDLFRALWRERGFDVLQGNLTAEQNSEIDRMVDERLEHIGKTEEHIVIDSRTAWHWIPGSYKVFLKLDFKIGAERILANMDEERRKTEHVSGDAAEYADVLRQRLESENRRYKKLYDIDPGIMDNYDLVIDTAHSSLEQVVEKILASYKEWLAQADRHV